MRILHVSPYSPVPPIFGGALRIYHLLRGLARRHEVTFVTFGKKEDRENLETTFGGLVSEIHVINQSQFVRQHPWLGMLSAFRRGESFYTQYTRGTGMQVTLDRLYEKHRFDATLIEFPHMGKFTFGGDSVLVLDEHNVEYSNFMRMYKYVHSPARKILYFREHRKTFQEELDACRKVNAIFTTSEHDKKILDEQIPEKPKYVMPNGVDVDYFVPSEAAIEPYSMVFTGTMDYVPNQDAMLYFLDYTFPLIKAAIPKARIYIVGKNPPKALRRRANRDIIVTGYVDDVRPYTWKAAVYVVPLRMGSGTRLKILEGLAMKKAIVTTSIGCEGIDVTDGRDVMIADDPASFAAEVINLLLNRGKAITLGTNGYELVKSKYDWDVVTARMDEVLTTLVGERARSKAAGAPFVDTKGQLKHASESIDDIVDSPLSLKVLMYHRVVDDNASVNEYSWNVSESQFRKQLEMLDRWGYTCINFEDYILFQQKKINLPKKPIIMTFDDGYDGVFERAMPIMREFGARGTAFVLGDRTITRNYWDEPKGFEGADLMDDAKISALRDAGFEIGSHSMTHPHLTDIPEEAAWEEITKSKDTIEQLTGSPVTTFAYPFGATNRKLEKMVQEAGYLFGCGVYSGPPKFAQNRFNIRRIPVTRRTNPVEFALKILTPYEYYQWARWETGQRLLRSRVKVVVRPPSAGDKLNDQEMESDEQ